MNLSRIFSQKNYSTPLPRHWNNFWQKKIFKKRGELSFSKKRVIGAIDKYLKKGKKALDAGSGSGFFSSYFIYRGLETWAIDYSKEALHLTRSATEGKAKAYFKRDLVRKESCLGLKNKFDLIFSDGLLEHFEVQDQRKIINNFDTMKKKDGLIITFVPSRYSLWQIIRPILMPNIREKPFEKSDFIDLFRKFEILEFGGMNVLPFKFSPEFLANLFGSHLYCVCR